MSKKFVTATSVQKGSYVIIENAPCKVTDIQISRPGKHGHAKVRLSAVGLIDGKKRIIVMPGHDNVEVPIIEKKNAQVLSISNNIANVMDVETYETFDLDIPEDLKDVKEGDIIVYWNMMGNKIMKQIKPQ